MKENSLDSDSGLARLEECLVPKASANQRQGRAGRTRPGKCFRLYTRRDEEGMRMFPIPEIQRVPLENVSLQVKAARPDEDTKVNRLFPGAHANRLTQIVIGISFACT